MKRDNSITKIMALLISAAAMFPSAEAQTVLSGDHVVEGNLEVGTATQEGGLTIKGETGTNASLGFKVTGDGGVIFEGTLGQGAMPQVASGKDVMMWYPGKAAFRIGNTSGLGLQNTNIGRGSVAFGNAIATGTSSIAMSGGRASGYNSTAMSEGDASGSYSTAMSGGNAWNSDSTAMSYGMAIGAYSTAMNWGIAGGDVSVAMNSGGANGAESIAMGPVSADAYRCVVVGSWNNSSGSELGDNWVETDPIFVVGNGTGGECDPPAKRSSNAFVILKNGNIQIPKRQGDILMGEFGNPEP